MRPDEVPDISAETIRQLREAGVTLTIGPSSIEAKFTADDGARGIDVLQVEGIPLERVVAIAHAIRASYTSGYLDAEDQRATEWIDGVHTSLICGSNVNRLGEAGVYVCQEKSGASYIMVFLEGDLGCAPVRVPAYGFTADAAIEFAKALSAAAPKRTPDVRVNIGIQTEDAVAFRRAAKDVARGIPPYLRMRRGGI